VLDLLKRHEIQVRRRAGVEQEKVVELTGASVRSVRRVEREPPVTSLVDPARRVGRPAKAEAYRRFLVEKLAKDPHVMSLESPSGTAHVLGTLVPQQKSTAVGHFDAATLRRMAKAREECYLYGFGGRLCHWN
jgi:hypothetical protein